jgi:lipid-A-disaccharide synthase
VPELVQKDFTPAQLSREMVRLLDSPDACQEMRRGLAEAREKLGPPGAVERAADLIVGMLNPSERKSGGSF